MDTVFVVTQHKPDNSEFPVIVKNVLATLTLARDYVAGLEMARDEEGEQSDGDLYWEIEACQVLSSEAEVLADIAEFDE